MPDENKASANKNVILSISAMVSFASSLMLTSVNVILPTVGNELSAGATMLGWVVTGPSLTMAAIMLPLGRIADIYGRKKYFLMGTLIASLGLFLAGISGSVHLLIGFQCIQGFGSGIVVGTSMAIITSVFPLSERGKAIGIMATSVYLGSAVGPYVGGIITQFLGWRSVFFLSSALFLVASILITIYLKGEWADARGERVDILGSFLLGISLVLIVYGFSRLPAILGIIFVPSGLAGLLVFGWWERRVSSPVFNVSLFKKNRAFIFSNVATLAHYSAAVTPLFLLSLYLQYIKGFTPSKAGLVMLLQPVCMAIVASISGRLSDRVAPRKIAAAGLALSCVALIISSFLNAGSSIWLIIFCLASLGIGIGLFSSPNTNAIMSSVEKKYFGIASSSVGMMRSIGGSLGLALTIIIISIHIGDVQITPDYFPGFITSMMVVFRIVAFMALAGFFSQISAFNKTSDF